MRRFFHRKTAQTRTNSTNGGQLPNRPRSGSSSSLSPSHVASPTGRVRAPALRSRSMSMLNGPPPVSSSPSRRFTRSLSFCAENQAAIANNCISRQLTTSEEDEVFQMYTRRMYGVFGMLCAIIMGFVIYAYYYNYGTR